MKRLTAGIFTVVMALSLTGCGAEKETTKTVYAMDTVMGLTAYGQGAERALEQSEAQIYALEAMLSRTREDSEVSRINQADGTRTDISPSLQELLTAAQEYTRATDGAFDITVAPVMDAWGFTTETYQVPEEQTLRAALAKVNGEGVQLFQQEGGSDGVVLQEGQSIDLGGIAKGYTSDCVEAIFHENAIESGMITLGGNVYVQGAKPDGSPWRIGIQNPDGSENYVGVLSLQDAYAITSGAYQRYFEQDGRRYHHIIDPSTGYPAESGLRSVTVVALANGEGNAAIRPGNGAMCDAFSTALFVLGEEAAIRFWRSGAYPFDLVLVTEDGRVVVTGGIAEQFKGDEASGYTYEIVR